MLQELKEQMEAQNSQQSNGQSNGIPDHSTWEKSEGEAEIQQEITRKMIEKSIERARGNVSANELKYLEIEISFVAYWHIFSNISFSSVLNSCGVQMLTCTSWSPFS